MELLPHVSIRDGYGASEIGVMASGVAGADRRRSSASRSGPTARLLSADRTRFLDRRRGRRGRLDRRSATGFRSATSTTRTRRRRRSPIVDGVRVAMPGDRARFARRRPGRAARARLADGEHRRREGVRRGGRGRAEAARRRRRRAGDRSTDERFGQEVTAIVQLAVPARAAAEGAARVVRRPRSPGTRRRARSCSSTAVERHPSGKADYRWARRHERTRHRGPLRFPTA